MSNIISPLRPAMTAIAAVIALSSTPLLSQAIDGAASQVAPTVVTPPPVVAAPAAPIVEQATASDASASAAARPVEVAPVSPLAMRTMSTPVVHTEDAQPVAPRASATKRVALPVTAVRQPVHATVETSAPAAIPAVKPAQTSVVAKASAPAPAPAATVAAVQTSMQHSVEGDAVPIAIGLGLAAIGGGAFAFSRRRRREDDEQEELLLEPTMMAAADPVFVAHKPARRGAKASSLPNGFDLSRFGAHTQAAYRGPTPNNPSFSLRRRLSRASFFDQRERESAEVAAVNQQPARSQPVAARSKAPATDRDDSQITMRMAPRRRSGNLGLAFQK